MRDCRATQRGFTLLEILVVLMITSLVSAILFQGLGSILMVRSTVASTVLNLRDMVLQRNIIMDPIRGIIPDHIRGAHIFRGTGQAMTGLTIRPLGESAGAPRPFELTFVYDASSNVTQLVYQGDGKLGPQLVASWPGNRGRFVYGDITGEWREVWPPPNATTRGVQTPWLVGVQTGLSEGELLLAYIATPHERRARLQDIGFGSNNSP
jgi:general secretion pathway protein J